MGTARFGPRAQPAPTNSRTAAATFDMNPAFTPDSSLTRSPVYNKSVMAEGKRAYLELGGLALVFAAVAVLLLLVLPSPHRPIHYLIAGTVATAVLLAAIGFLIWRGKAPLE